MPGRWVGGKGSVASPVKDAYIEAEVFTERGTAQGTILVKVKRIYAPGVLGRFFLGDLVSASDRAYREWTTSKTGRLTTVDGSYHLCKGPTDECPAAGQHEVTVHLGKWRTWKEEDLIGGEAPEGYGKEAKGMLSQYFKREGLEKTRGEGSRLPWTTPGELNLKKDKEKKRGDREEKERDPKKHEPAGRAAKVAKVSALEKELRQLKKSLQEEEIEQKTRPKKRAAGTEPSQKKPRKKARPAFDKGGLKGAEENEMGADWGSTEGNSRSQEDESEEADSSSSGEGSSSGDRKAKREADKKGAKKERKQEKRDEDKRVKKKKKKKKQKTKEKKGRTERDKGPFGVGETKCLPRDGSESEVEGSGSSSESSQSFRKAPSGLTLHLRLQRYAQRYPGRLATRLLEKMERATRFEGATFLAGRKAEKVRPCAVSYFLAILTPTLRDKWNMRTQREMRVWAEVLDQLAAGKGSTAADIAAQRLKALEQSVQDGNNWRKAKFLELVTDEVGMTDKGEEQMMMKEVELEEKFRGRAPGNRWDETGGGPRGKEGKGIGKNKGKDKGKWKTPAQEAAEKKTS